VEGRCRERQPRGDRTHWPDVVERAKKPTRVCPEGVGNKADLSGDAARTRQKDGSRKDRERRTEDRAMPRKRSSLRAKNLEVPVRLTAMRSTRRERRTNEPIRTKEVVESQVNVTRGGSKPFGAMVDPLRERALKCKKHAG